MCSCCLPTSVKMLKIPDHASTQVLMQLQMVPKSLTEWNACQPKHLRGKCGGEPSYDERASS